MKPTLSVIIITKNEEENIVACLESAKWAGEVIIIDNSSDNTVKLARRYTKRIYTVPINNFKEKRELGLKKAKSDWILFLDADERISLKLAEEIRQKLTKDDSTIDGYYIPFKHIFLGRWLRYGGWYPSYLPRLARRDKCHIEGNIHEMLKIDGATEKLKYPILHYSDKSIYQRIAKTNYYTTLQSQEIFDKGNKFSYHNLISAPALCFIKRYLFQFGFLDGIAGFIRAVLLAYTQFILHCKLLELYKNQKQKKKDGLGKK